MNMTVNSTKEPEKWAIGWVINGLPYITVYLITAPIIAAVMNFCLFKALKQLKVLPETVLIQLRNITVVTTALCFVDTVTTGLQLLLDLVYGFPYFNRITCLLWVLPANTLTVILIYAFAYLAIERWMTTRNDVEASKDGNLARTKRILVAVWIVPFLVMVIFGASQYSGTATDRQFCGSISVFVPKAFLYFLAAAFPGIEYCLAVFYVLIWLRNRNMLAEFSLETTRYSVIQRYQIRQTLRSFRMVAPSLLSHVLFCASASIFHMIAITENLQDNLEMELEIGLVLQIYRPLFFLFHPIGLFLIDKDLRNYMRKLFSRKVGNNVVLPMNPVSTVAYTITPNNNAVLLNNFWSKYHGN